MNIRLQCFGAFRAFGEQLLLSLPDNAVVSDIRTALPAKMKEMDRHFTEISLLDRSRFATQTAILPESAPLQEGMVLAIIPPVSGG